MYAIEVKDLVKHYGDVKAVDGVSFDVAQGEVFGLLGPNGAGKTTTLEMIETLREPDSGTITVEGLDIKKKQRAVKELLGVQLQTTVFFDNLMMFEMIDLFASFYKKSLPTEELLAMVGLEDKSRAKLDELSGGQQKRVSVALALVNDPTVVFLDEPTTGLDPQARRNIWDIVVKLREQGKTVTITTHYIEEAEQLCDRVAVMDTGKIIAIASPTELIERYAPESSISFRMQPAIELDKVEGIAGVLSAVHRNHTDYTVTTQTPQETLAGIFQSAYENGTVADEITMRRATLEDVFLKITGRSLRE
jgi:ABC-2 type transport system ATP-binding protein